METPSSLIIFNDSKRSQILASEIIKDIESKDINKKKQAIKDAIIAISNGEDMDKILMSVIRFCVHSEDHELKKLLSLYWEVVNKYNPDGTLKEEMILVCSALQDDLKHPNEYIRGATLRFLCRISESEILSPLIVPIKENLNHRHSYVRRYAIMCVYHIYQTFNDALLPDSPKLILSLIEQETDISCRRNAFLMLYNTSKNLAIQFMMNNLDHITQYGDGIQILSMKLIKKTCEEDPNYTTKFIKILIYLLNNFNNNVALEAANTLLYLSNSPVNVRAACETIIQILHTENDYNIKLIILNKLDLIRKNYIRVLRPFAMDILREINTQNEDILSKVLNIILGLISRKNVDEIIELLKKRLIELSEIKNLSNIQQLIIETIHTISMKYPETSQNIIIILMNFLSNENLNGVIDFVKEILQLYESSRKNILNKLLYTLPTIVNIDVLENSFWIIGKYSESKDQIETSIKAILDLLNNSNNVEQLNKLLKNESIITNIIVCLTRLILYYYKLVTDSDDLAKVHTVDISLFICEQLQNNITTNIEKERIEFCLQLILNIETRKMFEDEFLKSNDYFESTNKNILISDTNTDTEQHNVDELIMFRQLKGNKILGLTDIDIDDYNSINKVNLFTKSKNELNKQIYPFTGLGDPVYIETQLTIHDFDILLTIYLFNRTDDTLTDINLNLCCKGNIKVVERPLIQSIEPYGQVQVKANLKIESTEVSYIFGSFNYTPSSRAITIYLNLNTVQIDIMNYIFPAECTHQAFREMWSAFEWENRVLVQTHITELVDYLNNIIAITNSKCLTPITQKSHAMHFLAANLYAKTIFNEHALFNVCIAKSDLGINGYIRIRSKTQGIALSLGERITSKQDAMIV